MNHYHVVCKDPDGMKRSIACSTEDYAKQEMEIELALPGREVQVAACDKDCIGKRRR